MKKPLARSRRVRFGKENQARPPPSAFLSTLTTSPHSHPSIFLRPSSPLILLLSASLRHVCSLLLELVPDRPPAPPPGPGGQGRPSSGSPRQQRRCVVVVLRSLVQHGLFSRLVLVQCHYKHKLGRSLLATRRMKADRLALLFALSSTRKRRRTVVVLSEHGGTDSSFTMLPPAFRPAQKISPRSHLTHARPEHRRLTHCCFLSPTRRRLPPHNSINPISLSPLRQRRHRAHHHHELCHGCRAEGSPPEASCSWVRRPLALHQSAVDLAC